MLKKDKLDFFQNFSKFMAKEWAKGKLTIGNCYDIEKSVKRALIKC